MVVLCCNGEIQIPHKSVVSIIFIFNVWLIIGNTFPLGSDKFKESYVLSSFIQQNLIKDDMFHFHKNYIKL